jgi:hypothetical protein
VRFIDSYPLYFEIVPELDYAWWPSRMPLNERAGRDALRRIATKPVEQSPTTRHIYHSSVRRTTPGRGSVPKCLEPGDPNVSVILENSTSVPPVISMVIGDGETGAGFPLSVIVAVPFIRSPPVEVVVTSPSTRVMW